MTRWQFLTCLLAAGGSLGCETAKVGGRLYTNVAGVVTESPPGTFVFIDFDAVKLDGEPVRLPLRPYRRLTTENITRVDVAQLTQEGNTDYHVLFGPWFGVPGATVDGWIHTSRARFDFSGEGAWAYVAKIWPWVGAPWVSAQTVDSKFIVHIVDATLQRVIFLEGTRIDVQCEVGSARPKVYWTTLNSFVDVKLDPVTRDCVFQVSSIGSDGFIASPPLTSSDPTVDSFVVKVTAAATAGGI